MPQPPPRKVLFICHYNRTRSATAERLFCKRADLDVRSAGTSTEALARVNQHMLDWADDIFIMDDEQRRQLERMFPGHPALEKIVCLDIPDEYTFAEPALVTVLRERVGKYLPEGE